MSQGFGMDLEIMGRKVRKKRKGAQPTKADTQATKPEPTPTAKAATNSKKVAHPKHLGFAIFRGH